MPLITKTSHYDVRQLCSGAKVDLAMLVRLSVDAPTQKVFRNCVENLKAENFEYQKGVAAITALLSQKRGKIRITQHIFGGTISCVRRQLYREHQRVKTLNTEPSFWKKW